MSDGMEERLEKYLQALHEMANVQIDISKPLRLYVRTAETVYRQACIYRGENDVEKAFILFLKYSNLVLKELRRHPEYTASATASLRDNLLVALDALEKDKPMLLEAYRTAELYKTKMMEREREMIEAQKRDHEAKRLAEMMSKNQEEARKSRLIEMQRLDLQNSYTNNTLIDRLNNTAGTEEICPSLTPIMSSTLPSPPLPSIMNTIITADQQKLDKPVTSIMAKAVDYLENGMPLRSVKIPSSIINKFLQVANANTQKNLETCGVLAGKLAHDSFAITTLIIPKQTSTSDTVAMLNEEDIFKVQDDKDLLTLGWIHTHPTQQCFMSSVDLHTHFPYQLLIAEAIAIVIAPTQSPNYGIFRLTDPPGIGVISKCPQRGFHQHPTEKPIYTKCSDRHVQLETSLSLETIDLRQG